MHGIDLTDAELALRTAFAAGGWADLGAPATNAVAGPPQVRAEVLAALLLGSTTPLEGAVPALRLRGARITGRLAVAFARIDVAVRLERCTLDSAPDFTGATTRNVEIVESTLPGFDGRLMRVDGDLRLSDSTVCGCLMLENSTISGTVSISGARLLMPGGRALAGGGMVIGGGLFGRRGLRVEGTMRIIGARVEGGVLLEGATLSAPGAVALCADDLLTPRVLCSDGFRADGELQLRNAHVSGEVSLWGARLTGAEKAVRARGLAVGELICTPSSVNGLVDLSRAHVGALRDSGESWPAQLRIDGMTYDHLLAFGAPVDARARCRWLTRDGGTYRPQPYEQLADYYRRLGHDHDARRVLLAKQRRRRSTLNPVARAAGYLLDGLVGYGYRAWLAALWLAVLLMAGTAVFAARPPVALDATHHPHFVALVYTLDLLIPIGAFGLRGAYDPVGATSWVAYALIAAGWILATALIAGVSRSLRRD